VGRILIVAAAFEERRAHPLPQVVLTRSNDKLKFIGHEKNDTTVFFDIQALCYHSCMAKNLQKSASRVLYFLIVRQ
jgi:hypothetical protein